MSSFDTNDLKTEINTIFNATTNGPMRTLNASPEVGLSVDTLDVQKEGGSAVQDEAVRIPFTLPSLGRHCAGTPWLLMTFHDFSFTAALTFILINLFCLLQLEEFKLKEALTEISDLKSTFKFNELDKNEELWVMDIPITVRSFSFLY
jgi:hypothetical protein